MNIIFEPKGRAGEYAKLSVSLRNGCEHNCKYCYQANKKNNPSNSTISYQSNVLDLVKKDCDQLIKKYNHSDNVPNILLSFTTDPYSPDELQNTITRDCLSILKDKQIKFTILTKGSLIAKRDFNLYFRGCVYGTTLTFIENADSLKWEPNAALPSERINTIKEAYEKNIKTWVSLEPVIDTDQTLELIKMTNSFVDLYSVGKLNHFPEIENKINWKKFVKKIRETMSSLGREYGNSGCGYIIKDDLLKEESKGETK